MKARSNKQNSNEGLTKRRIGNKQTPVQSAGSASILYMDSTVLQRKPLCPCDGGCLRCWRIEKDESLGVAKKDGQSPGDIDRNLQAPRFKGDPILEACLDGDRILKFGDRGEAVWKIQWALKDAGFLLPVFHEDTIFGEETHRAVWKYQKDRTLQPDGQVGPETMEALDLEFQNVIPVQQNTVVNANESAARLCREAHQDLSAVLALALTGQLNLATGKQSRDIASIEHFLQVSRYEEERFKVALTRALELIGKNGQMDGVVLRRVGNNQYNCRGSLATATVNDPGKKINICPGYFAMGPQCQRNVLIHERFHLIGVVHGEFKPFPGSHILSVETQCALNSADALMDLVKQVREKPLIACDAGI